MSRITTALAVIALSAPMFAAGGGNVTEIMLVATYHMSNPGQDLNNVQVDDVLAPRRQQEIAQVTESLARFKPTRVAVEWPEDITSERYAQYAAGTLPVSRNEVVQLGFRLARSARLAEVNGLDVEGDFPFDDVQKWAKAHGRETVIDGLLAVGKAEVEKITKLQQTESVGGILRYLNQAGEIALNHSFYPPMLSMGSGTDQPGVKLLSSWYTRNLAICAKLVQTVKAGDRVVLFFGQGHIYLLRQCLSEQPNIKLVDALAYLPAASAAPKGGQGAAVESDIPMMLHVTGSTIRHSFALVIHDGARPRGSPSDWKPPRVCP